MKKLNLTIFTAILFILTACGEVATSDTQYSDNENKPLTMKIDNTTIYTTSHSRDKVTVNSEQNIGVISLNKKGSITLSGGQDVDFFELLNKNDSKILRFITTPEASNPIDSNKDGIYEVDIKATDYDGNSITYKVAYEIYKKSMDSYRVSLPYSEIHNYSPSDINAPRIQSFSVTGNSVPQNGKAVISKSKLNGKFSYDVTLKDTINADTITIGLKGGSKAIELDYSYGDAETMNFDCTFDKNNGLNKGINFTCNDISIQNTKGNANTLIVFIVCNTTTGMCSSARLPVLFTD